MPTSPWRPRQTRDVPSRRNGIWAKGDVTGLLQTCRGRQGEVDIVEFGLKPANVSGFIHG